MYSHKMRHRTDHLKDQKYALRDVHIIAISFIFLHIIITIDFSISLAILTQSI